MNNRDISLYKTSLIGLRDSNEDVELYNMNLATNGTPINPKYGPIDLFIVCDGHGGSMVSQFVAPKLEQELMKNNIKYPLSINHITKIYDGIQKMLVNNVQKIANECGCTALVVVRYLDMRKQKNIQVINIGDCRAVLSRDGLAIPLSKDHKPFWPDEKRRIDNVNKKYGTNNRVQYNFGDWRILNLSVSRSFGDLDCVPYVTHIPETFCYQLIDHDEFLVLACDGVYDVLQNHEVINFVKDHLTNNNIELYNIRGKYPVYNDYNKHTNNIARKLAEYAIARGSTDNVSVMIVIF